ncbi:MAG: BlaR1 peptidase [Planctomycetaceae bacterium]|nr:BlaR1 peptidase [Planctomycetaceae bacterium]
MNQRDSHSEQMPADRLERATAALRDAPLTVGPVPDLMASTLAALLARSVAEDITIRARAENRQRFLGRLLRYCGTTVAVMLLMFVLYSFLGDRGDSAAFAAVLQKIKQAQSVSLQQRQKLGEQPEIKAHVLMQAEAVRIEFPDTQVVVYDLAKKAGVDATPFEKRIDFHQFELSDEIVKKVPNLLQALRTSRQKQAERLGDETVNGRRQEIYRLKQFHPFIGVDGQDLKLWADAETGLPSKIDVRWIDQTNQLESYIVMEDFKWNTNLDPGLFDLKQPNVDCLKPALSRSIPINTAKHILPAGTQELKLSGRVLNPAGEPQSGAKIYASGMELTQNWTSPTSPGVTTDARGRFEITIKLPHPEAIERVYLTATHPGMGIVGTTLQSFEKLDAISLQFVTPGELIQGRITDSTGKPVSAAKVRLVGLTQQFKTGLATIAASLDVVTPTVTDSDGRFVLQDLGPERVATLEIEASEIERTQLRVSTSSNAKVGNAKLGAMVLSPQFEHKCGSARTIRGRVFDVNSSAPISDVQITISKAIGRVITDANGQFEFQGAPKLDKYGVMAVPFQNQPYLIGSRSVSDSDDSKPVTVDIGLTRGIAFSGRVLDAETGRPVQSQVAYFPLYPNPQVKPEMGYSAAGGGGAISEAYTFWGDSFTIAVLPGPGAICIQTSEKRRYVPVRVDPLDFFKNNEYGGDKKSLTRSNFLLTQDPKAGQVSMLVQDQYNAIILVNPKPGDSAMNQEIRLQPRK